jgi:GNAT superfamily N-acetyltransferase
MPLVKTLLQTSLDAGRQWLSHPLAGLIDVGSSRGVLVPICSLGPQHRERIALHLLALPVNDRYMRFGYMATDEQIRRYVAALDFDRDEIFGIFNRSLKLVAMAHLAYSQDKQTDACAEFGVSVQKTSRGRGYGARLFEHAAMHARNAGVQVLFIHALSENAPMISIARKHGARVERDGSETEAYLRLPPANWDSQLTELVSEQFAQTNYVVKKQVKRFLDTLAEVQEIRQGVREGRHRSAE